MATRVPAAQTGIHQAYLVVLSGVCAALHVWKLPPALTLMRDELGMTLVASGFLLSLVQLAGMTLGLLAGVTAEKIGLRRAATAGLLLLALGSAASVVQANLFTLLCWRALEGLGFLLVVLPGPALIRKLVPPALLSRLMGVWGCYIPVGSIIILLLGSWALTLANWRVLWLGLAAVTALMAVGLWRGLPADGGEAPGPSHAHAAPPPNRASSWGLIAMTLGSANIWMLAGMFAVYAGQWIAVIGFLPTIYTLGGVSGMQAGLLTALVAGSNAIGCFYAGRLMYKGFAPARLAITGYAAMALSSIAAFAFVVPIWLQFVLVLLFSSLGGLVPTTIFYLIVKLAPTPQATSTSVGWMQQISAVGQFSGPPLLAWVATQVQGWHGTWMVTLSASSLGIALAWQLNGRMHKDGRT